MKNSVCILLCTFVFFAACAEESSTKDSKEISFYGSIAKTALEAEEFANAVEAVDRALEIDESAAQQYLPISAHAYAQMGNTAKALEIFDALAVEGLVELNPIEQYIYMSVLAGAKRYEESEVLLNNLLGKKMYIPGLGEFGAVLYRRLNNTNKSLLYLYLEYEYKLPNATKEEKNNFLYYLMRSGNGFLSVADENSDMSYMQLIFLLDTVAGGEDARYKGGELPVNVMDSFIAQYALLKWQVLSKTNVDQLTVIALMELLPYFTTFSSYYWTLWQALSLVHPETKMDYLEVLKSTIQYAPDGSFAHLARLEACDLYGLDHSQVDLIDDMLF